MPVLVKQRLLSTLGLSAAVISCAATAPPALARSHRGCAHANSVVGRISRQAVKRAVVCLINRQRTERGLPALRENKRLDRSAQGWTNSMVRHGYFSHGSNFAARISAVGFNWSAAGENIATGFSTPRQVVAAWMASTGHCQNILSPQYSEVGTGVDHQGVRGYGGPSTWTQDFALPMGAHAPSGNYGPANGCPYG